MKPFNLEEALKGAKVVTRRGIEVHELKLFSTVARKPLVGVLEGRVHAYFKNGKVYQGVNHPNDLFMVPVIKTVFINLFDNDGNLFSTVHTTQEAALRYSNAEYYKSTIKCDYEE